MQFGFIYAPPLIIGEAVNCKVALMKASGPGVFTANSGDKILIKNRLLIREAKCFHLIR